MTVLRRRLTWLFAPVALAAVFGVGWAGGRKSGQHALTRIDGESPTHATAAGANAESSCTDRLAMEANANLVGQLHDTRHQLTVAREHASELEERAMTVANAPPARIVSTREEWARMARDRTVRMRGPCESWNSSPLYAVRKPGMGTGFASRAGGARREAGHRAAAAGISPEELETLSDVYQRAHARTWSAMRTACEAQPAFRAYFEERESAEEPSDARRVDICRAHVFDMTEPSAGLVLLHMAALRGAGHGGERASSDAERVAFAMTNAPAVLFDEMVRALGREKAIRAIDNGIVCVDEIAYDLREAPSEEG